MSDQFVTDIDLFTCLEQVCFTKGVFVVPTRLSTLCTRLIFTFIQGNKGMRKIKHLCKLLVSLDNVFACFLDLLDWGLGGGGVLQYIEVSFDLLWFPLVTGPTGITWPEWTCLLVFPE